jgi:RimJ/RimL family protein N-acetyltransferase
MEERRMSDTQAKKDTNGPKAQGFPGITGKVRLKLDRLRQEFERPDLDSRSRVLHLAELTLKAASLPPRIELAHAWIYELDTPPKPFGGLRDLEVRRVGLDDAPKLRAVSDMSHELVDERFARGDLAYVASIEGKMLAHAWFHRGPEPFVEDAPLFPHWVLPEGVFWSYHAYTVPEARGTGVFIKVFQMALHELWTLHGASRVRCKVKASNLPSIKLHERMGFRRQGSVTVFAAAGRRLVTWRDASGTKSWLQPKGSTEAMLLPPNAAH